MAGPLGERLRADGGECLVCRVQLGARVDPSALAAEPLAVEQMGPREVETEARSRGWATRRTGTSIAILGGNGDVDFDGERRITNLEDVFVLLTGEEIS